MSGSHIEIEASKVNEGSSPKERLRVLYHEVVMSPQNRLTESTADRVKRVGPQVVEKLDARKIGEVAQFIKQDANEDYVLTVRKKTDGYDITIKFNKRVEGMTTRGTDVFPKGSEYAMHLDPVGTFKLPDGHQSSPDDYEKAAYCLSSINRFLKDPKVQPTTEKIR